ncbi:MAG: cobalamin biosynthesis protein, partial [Pseudomonadota bacterium]
LATSDDKACAAAFLRLARKVGAPIRAMDAAVLERQVTVTHSAASHTARGTGSLAEAAALAAAGPGSTLITCRVVSGDGMATCALAEGPGS